MSRRVWFVMLAVVAVLAAASYVPVWAPALESAVRRIDLAVAARTVERLADQLYAFITTHPTETWIASGSLTGLVVVGMITRRMRRRRVKASDAEHAVPVPENRPVESRRTSETPVRKAPIPTQPMRTAVAGRGVIVRRLSADGHSTAEIARATRVGQDGVRAALNRAQLASRA